MDAPKGITPETISGIKAFLSPEVKDEKAPENAQEPESGEVEEAKAEVQTFRVKVDGDEIEVPLDELLNGYSRTSDYTRKTQRLSEEKKTFEAEFEAVKSERQQYAAALKALEENIRGVQEPDWEKLAEADPIEFVKQKELYRDRKEKLESVRAEQRRVAELQQTDHQKALQKYVEDEQSKLDKAIPEWKDANLAKTEKEKVVQYARSLGFTEAEISQLYDHRAILALRQGMLYGEVMSKKNSQVEKAKDSPRAVTPGAVTSTVSRDFKTKREQFAKTGKVGDFVQAFKALNQRK